MLLLFNTLSRLVITFLWRSKHLLISWLQSPMQWFWSPKNKVYHCFHCFPVYLPWSDGTLCHSFAPILSQLQMLGITKDLVLWPLLIWHFSRWYHLVLSYKCYLEGDDFRFLSSDFSPELLSFLSIFLLDIPTPMCNSHLHLNLSKAKLFFFLPKPSLFTISFITVHGYPILLGT